MRGGIAMTYYALTFLACERQRQIDADYRAAIAAMPLRVQLGRVLVALGTSLLARQIHLDEPAP
jgi:hypothetical protein